MYLTMIIIGVAFIGVAVFFYIHDCEYALGFSAGFGALISIVGAACLIVGVCTYKSIELENQAKIDFLTAQNLEIEKKFSEKIEAYSMYEKETLAEFKQSGISAVAFASIYPDLKTDELVKQELALYEKNNEEIKELQLELISVKGIKWRCFFSKGDKK